VFKRIYAIFRARNLEFLRDRGTLSWNIVLPFALMLGLSFIFSGDRPQYTVGILQQEAEIDLNTHPFLQTRYIEFVAIGDEASGLRKVARHQLDLLVSFASPARYWVNPDSPKGYFAELALLQAATTTRIIKSSIEGEAVRYVDWVLPGILAMNMMFSCLFGVGYVVVRYRKNGFLKRLRATPLRAIEFVIAQVASRLVLILGITVFVYAGTAWFLETRMDGSYLALFAVALLGCITLISLGLLVAARVTSEELAGGLLNLATWPMMMLSGVWYSLESASEWLRQFANVFPLTHILAAARSIMLDGSSLTDVAPQLLVLALMSTIFLSIAAGIFRWRAS
jgi:ABC-type multidrug transport system permease subunit